MLHQLVKSGYEVQVLGCTIFDNPKGMGQIKEQHPNLAEHLHQRIVIEDGELTHQLIVTQQPVRQHMTAHEEGLWYGQYRYLLDTFRPDVVWFYGGQTLDMLIADEARARGIPSAAYLVNSNYTDWRWCRDVDLIVTDTQATSEMYRHRVGFVPRPVGKFIQTDQFVADKHARERLLFINPSWPKGASVFVQLAEKLERERPDIPLEVVEARADWLAVLRDTTRRMGQQREQLSNVKVIPNTSDMRAPYSRARVLIAPSLWWESGARVLAEAALNGIPTIVSASGGNREMIGEGGWVVDLPEACFEKPYKHILKDSELQPLFDAVTALFDNEELYQEFVQQAILVGQKQHHIQVSTKRLLDAFAPLINQRAGNKDFQKSQRRTHKHKLAGTVNAPDFKAMPIPTTVGQPFSEKEERNTTQLGSGNFDWQFDGKLIVLDSRSRLLKMGAAQNLSNTGVFGIISFDPASEVSTPKQYEGSENIQVFQHALLGDGSPGTLHTCLDAGMSSTLKPLPQERLPERYQQSAQVLTKLPISTVALDNIEGLPSIDWLILDELSDTTKILEHGQQALKNTLMIQARVAFQPTHQQQSNLAELQHWASRNGFRFYRFNDMHNHSLFGQSNGDNQKQASELESADALFLPEEARLKKMKENQVRKLAFMLHTAFGAQDAAYYILNSNIPATANEYLESLHSHVKAKKRAEAEVSQKNNTTPYSAQHSKNIIEQFKKRAAPAEPLSENEKGIFIDCGGYDGCSALKFMLNNRNFECITFEPNPTLWPYYDGIPTQLEKKAAYIYNGKISFTLDSIDEDGSSLIKEKKIDFTGRLGNDKFKSLDVDCIDISEFLKACKKKYDKIILKMDIEGAEYDILEKLIENGVIELVDKLYCEFHWHKCGVSKKRHDRIVNRVLKTTEVYDWDALDFSIHKRGSRATSARSNLVENFFKKPIRENNYIFHLGAHRTGTTSLQEGFFTGKKGYFGRSKATYGGWGYEDCSKKLLMAVKAPTEKSLEDFIRSTNNTQSHHDSNLHVFSNEALIEPIGWSIAPFQQQELKTSPTPKSPIFDFLEKLKRREDVSHIKVIFIVRNQPDWLASFYSRISGMIEQASQKNFESQVENILKEFPEWVDWSSWIQQLDSIVGQKNVLVLPMESMGTTEYWDQLCDFIGYKKDYSILERDFRENVSSIKDGTYKIYDHGHHGDKAASRSFFLTHSLKMKILENPYIKKGNERLERRCETQLSQYGYL
ncbi:FkbM family methyltransferase [Chromohalobacter salexigens]|uniref:FkbM family methyltransferase n=1 Tax=Chromohalobacter israelensis TaxID=141390 RepID=UPI0032E8FFFC